MMNYYYLNQFNFYIFSNFIIPFIIMFLIIIDFQFRLTFHFVTFERHLFLYTFVNQIPYLIYCQMINHFNLYIAH
jgi:hypothetical protein